MKVTALISFSAYGIHARTGQIVEVERQEHLDALQHLGWIRLEQSQEPKKVKKKSDSDEK